MDEINNTAKIPSSKIGVMDRVILIGKGIVGKFRISRNCDLIVCERGWRRKYYFKYSYAGNVQYHEVKPEEAPAYMLALDIISEKVK